MRGLAMMLMLCVPFAGCANLHLNTQTIQNAAINSEKAYTVSLVASISLAINGQIPLDKLKEADAKAYALIVAARVGLDAVSPPNDGLIASRAAADAAHLQAQSL